VLYGNGFHVSPRFYHSRRLRLLRHDGAAQVSRDAYRGRKGARAQAGPLFLAEDADGFDACGAVGRENRGENADRQQEKGDSSEGERVGGADAENEGGRRRG